MTIIRKIPWTRQPPMNTGAATSGIGRGMIFLIDNSFDYSIDVMKGVPVNSGGRASFPEASGGPWGASRGSTFDDATTDTRLVQTTSCSSMFQNDHTIMSLIIPRTGLSGFEHVHSVSSTASGSNWFSLAKSSSFAWERTWDDNVIKKVTATSGYSITIDEPVILFSYREGATYYMEDYDQTGFLASSSISVSNGFTATGNDDIFTLGGARWETAVKGAPVTINLAVGWNRALTKQERVSLWGNPWQIFQPLTQVLNTFVAAGGGGGLSIPVAMNSYRQRQQMSMG